MNPRLGIACLLAASVTAMIAAGGCKYASTNTPIPTASPTQCGSPTAAPDTIYIQTIQSVKAIRSYAEASCDNGATTSKEFLPDNAISRGDVVYNPASDTLWYPVAYPYRTFGPNANTPIEMWTAVTTKNNMNPDVTIPFTNGFGAAAYDPTHNLLFVSQVTGPQVSVFANATTLTAAATPAAVITLAITDGGSGATPRPQEMLYDNQDDRLFVSDASTVVAVFDTFGAQANAAVIGMTNPTIPANRYLQGLLSPAGLAYAPPPTDTLFIGEQGPHNDVLIVSGASTINGPVGHVPAITGFTNPGGMAFDDVRGLLFVYDQNPIYVIPNAIAQAGAVSSLVGLHTIFDSSGTQNFGFGISLDITH